VIKTKEKKDLDGKQKKNTLYTRSILTFMTTSHQKQWKKEDNRMTSSNE
jgi:hypothetical protein